MSGVSSSPVLRAVRMSRSFGDGALRRSALRDVSVDLFPGQLALLMGGDILVASSGAGASFTLRLVEGGVRDTDVSEPDAELIVSPAR